MGTHYQGSEEEIVALDSYIKLSRAFETATNLINAHLQNHDLTISQFGVLEALFHLGPMQPGQLAVKILKSSGNLTMVIDNLVKRGLVTRQRREDDRRCIDIDLTIDGRALIETIFPGHAAGVAQTMGVLTSNEQTQLATLCRKLGLENMNQE
jgi:MarR family 2-MHQ and catechol resistance regulon transcriptional repressor